MFLALSGFFSSIVISAFPESTNNKEHILSEKKKRAVDVLRHAVESHNLIKDVQ